MNSAAPENASVIAPIAPPVRTAASAIRPEPKDLHKHAEFLARIKAGKVGLLFLGDSITHNFPGTDRETWAKFAPYDPACFGVSGDRTEHLLWRITNGELEEIDPKATVLLIGTNNIGHFPEEKPEWAIEGIREVVRTIHGKLPRTKLLLLAVFPRGKKDSPERAKVAEISAGIAGLADNKKTWYLDIGAAFLGPDGEIPQEIMGDLLHLSTDGYRIWYREMWPLLEKLLAA